MNYEQIIGKLEDILEEGKPALGGGGKIKLDGDAIRQCLDELSSSIPNEIIQARKIVAERRDILQAAQETAGKIVQEAQIKADEMTREHEITKAARESAQGILNEAMAEAKDIGEKAEAEATAKKNSAAQWAYEMRNSASEFAKKILGDCNAFLQSDIEHYTRSQENVQLALDRLQNVTFKRPAEEE